jgi:phosphate transport system permease protein
MSLVYFLGLILLVLVGYFFGRSRANAAANQNATLHSRPVYHGAFVALAAFIPMLAIFVVGRPLADYVVNAQALTAYDPAILSDELRRGSVLRDIVAVAKGQFSGTPSAILKAAR